MKYGFCSHGSSFAFSGSWAAVQARGAVPAAPVSMKVCSSSPPPVTSVVEAGSPELLSGSVADAGVARFPISDQSCSGAASR